MGHLLATMSCTILVVYAVEVQVVAQLELNLRRLEHLLLRLNGVPLILALFYGVSRFG